MNQSLAIPALSRALAAVALLLAPSARAQESQPVTSFENDEQMQLLAPRDTRIELVSQGVTDGSRALVVRFSAVQWPALFFRSPQPWDLRLCARVNIRAWTSNSSRVTKSSLPKKLDMSARRFFSKSLAGLCASSALILPLNSSNRRFCCMEASNFAQYF